MARIAQLSASKLPEKWRYCAIKKGDKAPIGSSWQNRPLPWDDVKNIPKTQEFKGKPSGAIGVLCGPISGGLLMFDHDGHSCDNLIKKLSGLSLEDALPQTVKATSGRPGRYQMAYHIPEMYWDAIKSKDYQTGVTGDDGKPEQIEFRWKGRQSVILGEHPMEGYGYRWVHSPDDTPVAEAPLWMIEKMLLPEHTPENNQPKSHKWTEQQWALSYLDAIIPEPLDWYTWRNVLLGAHAAGLSEDQVRQWSQRSSKHTDKGFSDVWRHIKGKADGVGTGTLGYLAKKDGWVSPFAGKLSPNQQNKVIPLHTPTTVDLAELKSAIDALASQGVDGSTLTLRLTALADEFHKPLNQVEKIFYQRRKEADVNQQAKDAGTTLGNLQQIRQSTLPIEAGLYGDGGHLAWQLRATAEAMPTAPEFLATTLIPVLASRIGTSQTLVISARARYKVTPIFRTMIVAPTGRKKTPAQKSIISVLNELESIHYQTYQLDMEEYERELAAWKPGSDEPKPKPPKRKRYVSTDDTLAARIQTHSENPKGLLLYRDEGSAFINERGRFSNGKGDGGETEADLSEFNGGSLSRDRKTDGSTFLAKTGISRTGAIQFAKLQELMGSHQDDCGEWARYLFCAADAPPSYLNLMGDDSDTGLQQTLINLIQKLDDLPERDYLLSQDAKVAFMEYQHLLTDRAIEIDHPALAAALPKFETYFGRFTLLLHVVNALLAGQQPTVTVNAHTVELARQWTEYYYGQFQLLMALNSPQQELTGDLLRLRDYIERRPGRTIRQLVGARIFDCSSDKSKRKTPYIRSLVDSLVDQGRIAENEGTYSITEQTVNFTQQSAQQPLEKAKPSVADPQPPAANEVAEAIIVSDTNETETSSAASPPDIVQSSAESVPQGFNGEIVTLDDDSPPDPTIQRQAKAGVEYWQHQRQSSSSAVS